MKSLKDKLKEESCVLEPGLKKDPSEKCLGCSRKLVRNRKGMRSEQYGMWFHVNCLKKSIENKKIMGY